MMNVDEGSSANGTSVSKREPPSDRERDPADATSPGARGTLACPPYDPSAPLRFIINGGSGRASSDEKRKTIETALSEAGRTGELLFVEPEDFDRVTAATAKQTAREHGAMVAVGGDGTLNAVAQGAVVEGCVMGVLPQGTFNYFARTHGIPTEPDASMRALLQSTPRAVQVGTVNGRVFLVNASLGLYPELLEDRETYKNRFGRKRIVALFSSLATLLREHHQLRLHVESKSQTRDVRTPTLFIGNNRLQFEQVGIPEAPALDAGRLGAVMLKPIRTRAMLGLLLRGALGKLGDADTVESFEFEQLHVRPTGASRGRRVKLAFDGEIHWMTTPLDFRVSPRPLFLLKPPLEMAAPRE